MDGLSEQREQQDVELAVLENGVHQLNCVPTDEEELPYPALAPVTWCGLKQTTRPRNWCLKVTCGPWLDLMSLLMVLCNCMNVMMYEPDKEKKVTMQVAEAFIVAFFVLEMVVKMVALGVITQSGGYLRNIWNVSDFVIVSVELLDYFLASLGIRKHISQALGPIRLIGRLSSLRDLVTVLIRTGPMLANVLVLCFFVVHVFAVMGVQLWAGQLRNRCFLGENISTKYNVSLSPYYMSKLGEKNPFICSLANNDGMRRCHDVPPLREDGETCTSAAPQIKSVRTVAGTCVNWNVYYNICRAGEINPRMGAISFDNIGFAWLAIFQVVTLEGWSEIMYHVMDAYSSWSCVFFVLVTGMGSFIMMNVCAVVIASQFSKKMERNPGEQADWFQRLISLIEESCSRRRIEPSGLPCNDSGTHDESTSFQTFKGRVKRIVTSDYFNHMVLLAIFFNVLTMAIEHHEQPKELTHMFRISNIIFTGIFLFEMAFKLLGLSWTYFHDRNNILDFVITIVSLLEVILNSVSWLSFLRALRVLRFVRLVHNVPYLKSQLLVLKHTIAKSVVLCTLLLFTILIFSVVGMQLFCGKFNFQTQNGDVVTDRKNFDSMLWAMVTVFQILTLEDWNLVLYNAMAVTSSWAALYFIVLIVFGKHVLLNILVGKVVESFQDREPLSTIESNDENPAAERERPVTATNNRVLRWCRTYEDWSLYIFSPQNKFRVFCRRVINHRAFDNIILFFIFLSCVTIAMERPGIDPNSTERQILKIASYSFSAIFLVEMLFKVLAQGLLFGKESYCRSSWNVVDGLLVILSLVHISISLASSGNNNMLGILKVLRLLRTLRPLRVIKRAPKLKLALEALIASMKPIGNFILICFVFFFFFAILGMQLFKGKFSYCLGEDTRNITSKLDCLSANYSWEKKTYNFDSFPQALMSLFVMYSKDGWVDIMYDGLDAVGVDQQPVRNNNEWMALYFIAFTIMSLILLDMFIGLMVETFQKCRREQREHGQRDEERGEVLLDQSGDPDQRPYYTYYSPLRRSIHTLCTGHFMELFVMASVFINVFMMSFEHYNQPEYMEQLAEYSNCVFTLIFTIEVLLKLVAFGSVRFIKIRWNLLDLVVVMVSIVSIVLTEMKMAEALPIDPNILRVCRVLRLVQVLKTKKIRLLLKTIIATLSQVGNICLLFMFFFFIFAALGVELFGRLECTDEYPCQGFHRHANFRHFGIALLTLYQVCTGDNWSMMMKDTLRKCHPDYNYCLSYLSLVSPLYFISFVVIAQFVLVNLIISAIMQALEDSDKKQQLFVRLCGTVVVCVMGLSFLVGAPGNLLVIWTILKHVKQRSHTVVLIPHLAVADLLLLITLPVWIYSLVHSWVFGEVSCKAIVYMINACMYSSVFLITVERFVAVRSTTTFIAGAMVFISSTVNPILYMFAARSFRRSLRDTGIQKLFRHISSISPGEGNRGVSFVSKRHSNQTNRSHCVSESKGQMDTLIKMCENNSS